MFVSVVVLVWSCVPFVKSYVVRRVLYFVVVLLCPVCAVVVVALCPVCVVVCSVLGRM